MIETTDQSTVYYIRQKVTDVLGNSEWIDVVQLFEYDRPFEKFRKMVKDNPNDDLAMVKIQETVFVINED